jgi:hypothetical protein
LNTKELIEALQNIEAEHGVLPVYIETTTTADLRDIGNNLVDGINASAQKCEFGKAASGPKAVWITGAADDEPEPTDD